MDILISIIYLACFVALIVGIVRLIIAAVKKKTKKSAAILTIVSLILCFILVPFVPDADTAQNDQGQISTPSSSSSQESSNPEADQSSSEQQAEPETTEAPVTYEATSESMQHLFENTFDFEYDELSCSIVEEDGVNVCNITYKNTGAAWDESAFVRQVLSAFIDFQRLAYDVDGIGAVRFEVWQNMTDDRGNTESDLCYQFMMDKDTCALYDWDALSGHPIMNQMQRDCAEFYIHPGILNNVNEDDVIYHSYAF